jgi:hypothetical protein
MKTLSLVLLLMASMAFVLLGCSDSSAPIVASSDAQHNASASLLKTSGPGAWIYRFEAMYWYEYFDANTGLLLTLGVNDLDLLCALEGEGMDVFNIHDLYLPNSDPELRRNVSQAKGSDVIAFVWRADAFPEHLCVFRNNNEPLAIGTAHLVSTDNDYYAPYQDNKNSNAFGVKAEGTLKGPDGQAYKLNLVYRGLWDGVDPASYKEVLKIQLTPTGK